MRKPISLLFLICSITLTFSQSNLPYVKILGVAQDAGYPQIACKKTCCNKSYANPELKKYTSCIAIVDPISKQQWIIDATPDIKYQIKSLSQSSKINELTGVLLTHAHMGHYTGIMHFGREAQNTHNLPVYCMPRMSDFLRKNGPWNQLVELNNINIIEIKDSSLIKLNQNIQIRPFSVPHRDEFSETVGYQVIINNKSLVFIPDIDKWEKWDHDIIEIIKKVDYALLDATFYQNGEIERDMSEIPHPFVKESMEMFSKLDDLEKKKIHFIHFNHTNPLLIDGSEAQKEVTREGYNIAKENKILTF